MKKVTLALAVLMLTGCSVTVTRTTINTKGEGHTLQNEVLQEQTNSQALEDLKAELGL